MASGLGLGDRIGVWVRVRVRVGVRVRLDGYRVGGVAQLESGREVAVAVEHPVAGDDDPLGLVAVRGEAAVVRVGDAPVVCEDVTLTWLGFGLGLGLEFGFGFGLALALELGFGFGFGLELLSPVCSQGLEGPQQLSTKP